MKKNNPVGKPYYSAKETAIVLGINIQSVYLLCKRNDFPAVRISPRRIVIPADDLANWMRNNAGNQNP